MGEQVVDRDEKAELDERRIAKGVAIALPIVTVATALVVAVASGPAVAILVLAAGVLLGVIALFWASLRILSGDAPLSPELEALDASAQGVDPLASRRLMLVRALKDLDNERALGKLEDEDYEQLTQTYRGELKEVLRRMDAALEPHRAMAEAAAHAHLVKAGVLEAAAGYRGKDVTTTELASKDLFTGPSSSSPTVVADLKEPRLSCPKCETSNEIDASFCKKCGTALASVKEEASDEA